MSTMVSLPNHTFTGQAESSKQLTSNVHILSPEADNCPSWISTRERMTVENISWSISTKECCRPRRELNPRPPGLQSDRASNWATEAGMHSYLDLCINKTDQWEIILGILKIINMVVFETKHIVKLIKITSIWWFYITNNYVKHTYNVHFVKECKTHIHFVKE